MKYPSEEALAFFHNVSAEILEKLNLSETAENFEAIKLALETYGVYDIYDKQ